MVSIEVVKIMLAGNEFKLSEIVKSYLQYIKDNNSANYVSIKDINPARLNADTTAMAEEMLDKCYVDSVVENNDRYTVTLVFDHEILKDAACGIPSNPIRYFDNYQYNIDMFEALYGNISETIENDAYSETIILTNDKKYGKALKVIFNVESNDYIMLTYAKTLNDICDKIDNEKQTSEESEETKND